ncbi:yippee-like protein [Nymphaea thermarum]|nr:yippee-like protein [Nymphaea thermarum]
MVLQIETSLEIHNPNAITAKKTSSVNVTVGILEDKLMLTGLHTVADIYCNSSHQLLGEKAYSKAQMYKEGKFILERLKKMMITIH